MSSRKKVPVRTLCFYLRRYLERGDVRKNRARLAALHQKTAGTPLSKQTLWRHLKLKKEPSAITLIAYLTFLNREGAIKPNGKKSLFVYAYPELLRAEK